MASRDYEAVVRSSDAVVLWDKQNCLPLQKILSRDDIIVFLTPVVVPYNNERSNTDPFEPLGRAIAARHPKVHHVPYTLRDGITSTHVAHIKKARVIVFVISGPPGNSEPNQAKDAEIARIIGEHLPQIVIACFSVDPDELRESVFPTLIQIPGYSPSALENAAALLFGEGREGLNMGIGRSPPSAPESWPVEPWNPNDIEPVQRLWHQSLPRKFHLADLPLKLLLSNPGYSSNYIVREPKNRTIIGFCATYTSFVDEEGYKLIGSLVMLLVDEAFQGRGVGRTLHAHALAQLRRTRGVQRLQLGSTFPRLLYGIPSESPSLGWFRRRGWSLDENLPGRGRTVCDWVLSFEDWPRQDFTSAGLEFRPCKFDEYGRVIKLVEREAGQKDEMGWYEQYRNLTDTFNVPDVILGLEGEKIVATALTYCPNTENQASRDLPWARNVSDDVGGITCICIIDDNRRDLIFIRLLHACIQSLTERGMRGLFLDGMKGKDEGFQSLGFQKWASYQESWRSI